MILVLSGGISVQCHLFKCSSEAYKKARDESAIDIPESVLILEKAIREQQSKVAELKKVEAEPEDIRVATLALSRLEQHMVELLKELKLA